MHPQAERSYLLRSYLVCALCERRMIGKTRHHPRRDTTCYVCVTNAEHHGDQPWYPHHPRSLTVREDQVLPAVAAFFGERVLGPHRATYLTHQPTGATSDQGMTRQRTAVRRQLDQLTRAQHNLLTELETYQPTGDHDIDSQWRAALQHRFARNAADQRATAQRLAALDTRETDPARGDPALLDLLPHGAIDPTQLSDRDLYDAFHLQVRYHRTIHQLTLRVTIYAQTIDTLTQKIHNLTTVPRNDETAPNTRTPANGNRSHAVGAPGGSRTTWERVATSDDTTFVVINGVWPLPPRG